jgi:phage antirepressor YoqD-like protein
MNEIALDGDTRMTVREVADVLGVSERVVQLAVKKMFPEIVKNGVPTYLNESQVTAIKMGLESHHNLEGTFEVSTRLERQLYIAKALQFANEEIQQLQTELSQKEQKIATDAPKVEFFNQVADSKDALQMRDVAAALNLPDWGRNKIFSFLRKRSVLDDRNVPYRDYQDRGYFRVIEQKFTDNDGETHISLKMLVYQRGVEFIRKLIPQAEGSSGDCFTY